MRVVVVRHHPEDDAGLLGESLEARGATLVIHEVMASKPFPDLDAVDRAVVLGAKWSLYDDDAVGAWIGDELDWLRAADAAGVALLGVCFGAQALAAAFGGDVERAPRPEIGWTAVDSRTPQMVPSGPWFQMHGDRCLVPPAAEVLADNEVAVQAFRLGRHLAVQFHPELDHRQLCQWIENGAGEIITAAGLDPGAILERTAAEGPAARKRAEALIGVWLEMTDPPAVRLPAVR